MAAKRSGQVTVTTAGTAVAGPSTPKGTVWQLIAPSANTGVVYVGNDGADDVTAANGFVVSETCPMIVHTTPGGSLAEYYFDAATNGDKICWLKLE